MKKQYHRLNMPYSQALGEVLVDSFKEPLAGGCVSLEEIAGLVDGSIQGEERDRIMVHLSACDRCYQTFLLTADLQEKKLARRSFVSHPLRLAASIIVAAFSIFLFYKIVFIPKASEKLQPSRMLVQEQGIKHEEKEEPAAPVDELKDGDKKTVTGKAQPAPGKRGDIPVSSREEFTADEEKPGEAAKEAEEKSEQEQDIQAGVGIASLSQAPAQRQDLQKLKKNEAADRRYQGRDSQSQQYQLRARDDRQKDQKGQPAAPQKMGRVVWQTGEDPVWHAADRLNRKCSGFQTHIPQDELPGLFKETLDLAGTLQYKFAELRTEASDSGDFKKIDFYIQRLKPAIDAVSVGNVNFILPALNYFQKMSSPGSAEFEFFRLARSGWCDRMGLCKGEHGLPAWNEPESGLTGKEKKDVKAGLLKEWQKLQPRLNGIFLDIAHSTIAHLSQDQDK